MHRVILIAVLSALTLGVLPAPAQESLESVDAKIRQAWDKHKSMSGVLGVSATVPIGETRLQVLGSGTVEYLKDNGKDKFRQQLTAKLPEPMTLEGGVDIIYDGSELYLTTDFMGKKDTSTSGLELYKGAVPPGGGLLLDMMKSKLDVTVKPDAVVDGKPVWVLQAVPKEPVADVPVQKAIVYIDKDTGAALKTELFESDAVVAATITVSDVKMDPILSPSLFVYVPPTPPAPAAPAAATSAAVAAPTPPPIPPAPTKIK